MDLYNKIADQIVTEISDSLAKQIPPPTTPTKNPPPSKNPPPKKGGGNTQCDDDDDDDCSKDAGNKSTGRKPGSLASTLAGGSYNASAGNFVSEPEKARLYITTAASPKTPKKFTTPR